LRDFKKEMIDWLIDWFDWLTITIILPSSSSFNLNQNHHRRTKSSYPTTQANTNQHSTTQGNPSIHFTIIIIIIIIIIGLAKTYIVRAENGTDTNRPTTTQTSKPSQSTIVRRKHANSNRTTGVLQYKHTQHIVILFSIPSKCSFQLHCVFFLTFPFPLKDWK